MLRCRHSLAGACQWPRLRAHASQADGCAARARVAADAQVLHQLVQARRVRQVQVAHLDSPARMVSMQQTLCPSASHALQVPHLGSPARMLTLSRRFAHPLHMRLTQPHLGSLTRLSNMQQSLSPRATRARHAEAARVRFCWKQCLESNMMQHTVNLAHALCVCPPV